MRVYFEKGLSLENVICAVMGVLLLAASIVAVVVAVNSSTSSANTRQIDSTWGYQFIDGVCKRVEITLENVEDLDSLAVCNLKHIEYGTLLPRPTGKCELNDQVLAVNVSTITFTNPQFENQRDFWVQSQERFLRVVKSKIEDSAEDELNGDKQLEVRITVTSDDISMTLNTNESYTLTISSEGETIVAAISGQTYFGARHGLETLSQLLIFNEFDNQFVIPATADVIDGPVYKYRGILLDTVRHFYRLEAIKRTIDTMALVKLNVFHWHITDSQSFPLIFESYPEYSKLGAYTHKKRYSIADIKEVVLYAKIRGVRVIPEFDAPSHVSEGWQHTDFVACRDFQPWEHFCVGAPCGQLDPTKEGLYEVLDKMYQEMNEAFEVTDLFHMGGDEVMAECWNTSKSIQTYINEIMGLDLNNQDSFIKLWKYFQDRVQALFKRINGQSKIILWTSSLTEADHVEEYLNKDDYIIHVWTNGAGAGSHVPHLLEKGYDIIMSNADSFYFDCGFGSWVKTGNNWCSPYKGWHQVYNNNLARIADARKNQVVGGAACLWSSLSGEETLDSRLWPRASALAERLWTEPEQNYRHVETRILMHRHYLVQYGITPESLQPEYCMLHQGECPAIDD